MIINPQTNYNKMKKIYLFLLLLAATVLTTTVRAQVINGDLNHNQGLDVEDVTLLIDGYLSGTTEQIQTGGEPYGMDNSLVTGTWYRTKTDKFTLNADGTTDYGTGYTYMFLPVQGCILFSNAAGNAVAYLKVLYLPADKSRLVVKAPNSDDVWTYYDTFVQRVESITLSATELSLDLDGYDKLTATVLPADADNLSVEWISSDETVATVSQKGLVEAVGEGTAIITCMAVDGSGVKATCEVTVGGTPPASDHEYVDLGLSVKWATMNIGANAPEEYGDYFAWGETTPKNIYSWNYAWNFGTDPTGDDLYLSKYCTNSKYGKVDNKVVLDLEDDAAHVNWGGTWRMPTYKEFDELMTTCTWEWTTLNDVNGFNVTGPNGNSIFLPAAGYHYDNMFSGAVVSGYYWSSSLSTDDARFGWSMDFSDGYFTMCEETRYYGESVRAVCP